MNYLQRKKLAFMSIVNRIKGFVRTITGTPPLVLPDCVGDDLINYTISGNSVQDGTPAPDNPVEIESVGEYDEATGKYKIPIKVSGDSGSTETVIYLDEPLRKVGDVADYIDFENGKVVRNIKTLDLDHNNSWIAKYTWGNKNSINFMLHLDDDYNRAPGLSNRNNIFGFNQTAALSMWIGVSNNNLFWIGILDYLGFEDDDNSTAVNKFKIWLADNPTYIHYPTSTPTEEPINLPQMPTFKGTTVLAPGTVIQPSNMSATYYSTSKE